MNDTTSTNYREIPYNYTSFSDHEIVLRYLDEETWRTLDQLRSQRITGRSAKLLFEILGDIFAIDRNPYIYNDFLENKSKRQRLLAVHKRKQRIVRNGAKEPEVMTVLAKIEEASAAFFNAFDHERARRAEIKASLGTVTGEENIFFSAFHKVLHVTDATDWRVAYPKVVVYPSSAQQIPALVVNARGLGLKIIPRGGGTGLTGGAVPVHPETMILNLEKLRTIGPIEEVDTSAGPIPTIKVDAGVITDQVTAYCKERNYVFATDPTSAWASTIGGNIAENCGGKKAVIWGCALDNILSFQLVDATGRLLEIERVDHPYRKIEPDDTVRFDVTEVWDNQKTHLKTIQLTGTDIRKKGVGKDITNKALNGLPGVQKEGGDGIIVSARFVLYRPFAHKRTVCLEFFGDQLDLAAKAIVATRKRFDGKNGVVVTALEHFDDKYVEAIHYRPRSNRNDTPLAVLLIDVESNNEKTLDEACTWFPLMAQKHDAQGFVASSPQARAAFWADRKNLGAIARHTNAFKLNEDVVIPIEALPRFAKAISDINDQKTAANDSAILAGAAKLLRSWDFEGDYAKKRAMELADRIERGETTAVTPESIMRAFHGHQQFLEQLNKLMADTRSRKIIVATHMHAGDGNVHVNIPVHSSDYEMMQEADQTVGDIMNLTKSLGGVISGEHGIGLTKLKFIDDHLLEAYRRYKDEMDPDHLFNPMKLTGDFRTSDIYTPSLRLLNMEAFILEATDLKRLTDEISACVRCGKCKEVCNTHYPRENTPYCPRNKILAVSLIVEAVLYEAQTSTRLTVRNFRMLKEISSHCTMCHNCHAPCPVNIDFGEVTLFMRRLLARRIKNSVKPVTAMTLAYLNRRGFRQNRLFRLALLRGAYAAGRLAHWATKPLPPLHSERGPALRHMLAGRFPKVGRPSFRDKFNLSNPETCYVFHPAHPKDRPGVFYFPGCGAERMFADISFATLALLNRAGIKVVVAPSFLCCGYPMVANGLTKQARIRTYENSLLFHRMAQTVGYLNIQDVLVSCGTCHEMLSKVRLEKIFSGARVTDISEYLVREALFVAAPTGDPLLYHEPCHTPLKQLGFEKTITALIGSTPRRVPNCCGEGGTMALSTPEISTVLRTRKARHLAHMNQSHHIQVATTCPSCVQGLSKIDTTQNVTGAHLVVLAAEKWLGQNWKKEFIAHIKKQDLIERVLI